MVNVTEFVTPWSYAIDSVWTVKKNMLFLEALWMSTS